MDVLDVRQGVILTRVLEALNRQLAGLHKAATHSTQPVPYCLTATAVQRGNAMMMLRGYPFPAGAISHSE